METPSSINTKSKEFWEHLKGGLFVCLFVCFLASVCFKWKIGPPKFFRHIQLIVILTLEYLKDQLVQLICFRENETEALRN